MTDQGDDAAGGRAKRGARQADSSPDVPTARPSDDAARGQSAENQASDDQAAPTNAETEEATRDLAATRQVEGKAARLRGVMAPRPAPPRAGRSLLDRLTPHRRIVLASAGAAVLVAALLWVALEALDPLPAKPTAVTTAAPTAALPANADKTAPDPKPVASAKPPASAPNAAVPPPAAPAPAAPPPSIVRQMDTQPLAVVRQYAEGGDVSAQMELGRRYYRGIGVEKSDSEAAKWIERAAEQGDPNAQFNVGVLYEQGLGVPRDVPRAMEWYKKAAAHGMPLAMHNMAMALHRGEGIVRNLPEVRRLLLEAAELGLIQSQFSLALVYEQGVGGPVDKVRALAWMSLAARSNDAQIVDRLQKMSAASLPSDVEQGQNLAVQLAARIVETRRKVEARNGGKPGDGTSNPLPPISSNAAPNAPANMPSLSNAVPPPQSPGAAKPKPGDTAKIADRNAIQETQRLLASLKLYGGPINGNFGPQTEKAVRDFQTMSDMPVDGTITAELLSVLREIAAAAGQPKGR